MSPGADFDAVVELLSALAMAKDGRSTESNSTAPRARVEQGGNDKGFSPASGVRVVLSDAPSSQTDGPPAVGPLSTNDDLGIGLEEVDTSDIEQASQLNGNE